MTLNIEINLDNSAFDDSAKDEVLRIVNEAISKRFDVSQIDQIRLFDYNGNAVGMLKLEV